MRIYTAHLKPDRPPILVREGWSWGAALFGGLWLLLKRAWIPAVLQMVAVVLTLTLAPPATRGAIVLGIAVLTGLLGRDLVRWSLARRGYALSHVLASPDADSALVRLLTARPDLVAKSFGRSG